MKDSVRHLTRRLVDFLPPRQAETRFALDNPADRMITGRVELFSGWVDSQDPEFQLEAACDDVPILIRRFTHPLSQAGVSLHGFYGYLFVQEHLSSIDDGCMAIRLYLNRCLLATLTLRVSCLAQELAVRFPLNRQTYRVCNRAGDRSALPHPHTLVFPGLGSVGGTSVNELFRQLMYRQGWQFPVYSEANDVAFWKSRRHSAYSEIRWIDGHGCYHAADTLDRPASRITFLREPISRLISVFNYNSLVHPFEFPFSSLQEFLASDRIQRFSQARGLLRCAGCDRDNLTETQLYELAVQELRDSYDFIGITEYFEDSIFLICDLAGYAEVGMWWRVLSSPSSVTRSQVSSKSLQELNRSLAVDLQLYEEQRAALLRLMEKADFGQELKDYKTNASEMPQIPELYKLTECLRWRQMLAEAKLRQLVKR